MFMMCVISLNEGLNLFYNVLELIGFDLILLWNILKYFCTTLLQIRDIALHNVRTLWFQRVKLWHYLLQCHDTHLWSRDNVAFCNFATSHICKVTSWHYVKSQHCTPYCSPFHFLTRFGFQGLLFFFTLDSSNLLRNVSKWFWHVPKALQWSILKIVLFYKNDLRFKISKIFEVLFNTYFKASSIQTIYQDNWRVLLHRALPTTHKMIQNGLRYF